MPIVLPEGLKWGEDKQKILNNLYAKYGRNSSKIKESIGGIIELLKNIAEYWLIFKKNDDSNSNLSWIVLKRPGTSENYNENEVNSAVHKLKELYTFFIEKYGMPVVKGDETFWYDKSTFLIYTKENLKYTGATIVEYISIKHLSPQVLQEYKIKFFGVARPPAGASSEGDF